MTLFKQYKQPSGTYNPLGNRRVYQTKWLNTWTNWERDNAMIGPDGSYLQSIRYRPDGYKGIHKRMYLDTSRVDIDMDRYTIQGLNPIDTKFMKVRYRGTKLCRKDLAEMIPSKLEEFIESLGTKRTNPQRGLKRRLGTIPKKSVTKSE